METPKTPEQKKAALEMLEAWAQKGKEEADKKKAPKEFNCFSDRKGFHKI